MRKFRKVAALLAACSLMVCLTACGDSGEVAVGTGNSGGNYYAYGNVLADLAGSESEALDINVKTTAGSAANLRLMKDGYLQMAIVQSDVLQKAVEGTGEFEGKTYANVRALAGLYTEEFQIIVPKDSKVNDISDLKGLKVSIGEEESGVAVNAVQILEAAGLAMDQIERKNLSFSDSAKALAEGEIDAFFLMAGAPTTAVTELSKEMDIRVVSLDDRTIDTLISLHPEYTKGEIKAGTYKDQEEDVRTVGVKAVLVADASVSDETVKRITGLLFDKAADFKYATSIEKELDLTFATEDIPCEFHDGAAAYYGELGIKVEAKAASREEKKQASQDE